MVFLLTSLLLVAFFFALVALLVVFFMDAEGKQALKLNAQVEMQIIIEDLEAITRFSARVRLVRIRLASKPSLQTVFN